jgi:hypothetical protein
MVPDWVAATRSATKRWHSGIGDTTCLAATAGTGEESMPQSRHRTILRLSGRSPYFIVPLIAIGATALGIIALLHGPAAENGVVRRTVAEMPKLDLGVEQAVHATFVGDRSPAVGQSADLRLIVTSSSEDVRVRAEIHPPAQAVLQKGLSTWDGTLSQREAVEIPVSVTLDGDKGGFVRAEITAQLPDGREIRSATAIFVDPGSPDNPAPQPKTLVEKDGQLLDVVVYRPAGR